MTKQYEDDDDDRFGASKGMYNSLVDGLIIREIPYGGEFTGFEMAS